MRRIIKNIFLLIFTIAIVDITFGFTFKKYIFDKTLSGENGGSLNYLLTKKKNVDFLIFGTSRAKHHFNPDSLFDTHLEGYNAGINGTGGIIYNTVLLDLCIHHNVNPKLIILQLDVMDFCDASNNYSSDLIFLYPFYNESKVLRDFVAKDGWKETLLAHSNLYRFNGKLYNIAFNFLKKNSVVDNNGFVPLIGVIDTTKLAIRAAKCTTIDKNNKQLDALNQFYNMCTNNKIELKIVLPPSYKNYIYFPNLDDEFTTYLKAKMPKATLLNYSNIECCKSISGHDNWKDELHLNEKGAAVFSKIVNNQISQ